MASRYLPNGKRKLWGHNNVLQRTAKARAAEMGVMPHLSRQGEIMTLEQREAKAKKIVAAWNKDFMIGQRVVVKEDFKKMGTVTQTRSAARVLCGDAVVWCDGISGAYSLSHVIAIKA